MAVGKCAVAFLPTESAGDPLLLVNKVGGIRLNLAHQIGQRHSGPEPNKNMCVVGDAMNRQELLALIRYDAGNIFVQLFLVLG